MTACVNKKSKRVAAVVTASLVGALSIGAPAVALAANNTSIDLLATDANAFAKGTVSYKYGMEAGADFTYTGYQQGLVPSKVEVYNGDTEFPELRPQSGLKANSTYYYYVKLDSKGSDVAIGGVKVQYKNAKGKLVQLTGYSVAADGSAPATPNGTYGRPVAEGTYAVVVASTDASGSLNSAVSVADTFTITGQSLDGAVLYEGDDMSDTDFGFSGGAQTDYADTYLDTLNLSLGGVQLDEGKEVNLSIYVKGGKDPLGHNALTIGQTYVVKAEGVEGSRFEGQSIQREFVYGKLDLSKADIVADVFTNAAPTNASTFKELVESVNGFACEEPGDKLGNVSDKVFNYVDVTFVSGPSGSISGGNGVYTYKLTAKPGAGYVTGETTIEVHKADHEAAFKYDGKAIDGKEFVTDLSEAEPVYFDLSKISVEADGKPLKSSDYKVVVKNAAGEEVSADSLKTAGTYTVTVVCDTELDNGKAVYGTASKTVKVLHKVVEAKDVFFSYNKQNIEKADDFKVLYDGSDFSKGFSVKVTAGSKELAEGTDYDVVITKTQKDGKKVVVDSVTDAGEYNVAITGKTFVLSDGSKTANFGFDVEPVKVVGTLKLEAADCNYGNLTSTVAGVTVNGPAISDLMKVTAAVDGSNYYLAETGSVIAPTFSYKVSDIVSEIPADAIETEYRDEANKVVDLKDAGVYTARIVSKSEAGNYDVDVKVTNLVVSSSKVFSDVHTSDWFYKPVFEAKKLNYMGGYSNSSLFGPNKSITRGEVACVLFNMAKNGGNVTDDELGWNEDEGYMTGFSDVNGKAFYAKAISWAKRAGVVNGYGDGTFAPEKEITREEFACMLANFAKLKGDFKDADEDAVLAEFPDGASVSDWAEEAVAWAADAEIMGNNGSLTPGKAITRAEVAAMAVNYQPKGQEDLVIPTK